jgi:hypothetical protein
MSVGASLNAGTNTADKTTATLIVGARTSRDELVLTNSGAANNVYVGVAGVTTATGYKLIPGAAMRLDEFNGAVYVIADNAAASVSWAEVF